MNLSKEIKSIVITYEDEECVQLTGEEAQKFKEVMTEFVSVYRRSVLNPSFAMSKRIPIDLASHFKYKTIRPALLDSDFHYK